MTMQGKSESRYIVGLSPEAHRYFVNGVTYIVESRFEPRKESQNTLRKRFEKIIKTTSTHLTEDKPCGKMEAEYVPAVGKETNAGKDSEQ